MRPHGSGDNDRFTVCALGTYYKSLINAVHSRFCRINENSLNSLFIYLFSLIIKKTTKNIYIFAYRGMLNVS